MDLAEIINGLFGANGRPVPLPPGTKKQPYGSTYDDGASQLDLEALLRPELAATTVPKEKQGAQAWENAQALLGITPIVGNALSAKDARENYNTTVDDWGDNSNARNALNVGMTGLSALGAVTGLPFSKIAGKVAKNGKSTASVFFPSVEDDLADKARDMRLERRPGHDIHRETGRVVSPEGGIYEEIPDTKIKVKPHRGGDKMLLGQAIEHPELFDNFPKLRDQKVRYGFDIDPTKSNKNLTAHTTYEGDFLLPVDPLPSDYAKLIQYRMNNDFKLPKATRHSLTNTLDDFAKSAEKASTATLLKPGDLGPLAKYTDRIEGIKGFLQRNDIHEGNRSRGAGEISSGNITARRVQQRQIMDPAQLPLTYPYGGRPNAPSTFQNLLPLIPDDLTPGETRAWLDQWAKFGTGAEQQGASLEELLDKMSKR